MIDITVQYSPCCSVLPSCYANATLHECSNTTVQDLLIEKCKLFDCMLPTTCMTKGLVAPIHRFDLQPELS
jgi:hypothetical protein